MKEFLTGARLYGDNFSTLEIQKWFDEEAEAYADLGDKTSKPKPYTYHNLNKTHGFRFIKNQKFKNVLGLGSAWGFEFEPLIKNIENLTIVESSEQLKSENIKGLIPNYIKPNVDGKLIFEDNTFDLITCFGTLHHIPNVSFVLSELVRVLAPGGYLLIREPIQSMGDWRYHRQGLTKNERGIPIKIFENVFSKLPVSELSRSFCFTLTYHLNMLFGNFLRKPIYYYKLYVVFDKFLSSVLKFNITYHPTKKIERIAPSSVFYVLQKNN